MNWNFTSVLIALAILAIPTTAMVGTLYAIVTVNLINDTVGVAIMLTCMILLAAEIPQVIEDARKRHRDRLDQSE